MKNNNYLIYDGLYNNQYINPTFIEQYISNKPTKLMTIEIKLEINIPLISYARGSCGSSRLALFRFPLTPRYYW